MSRLRLFMFLALVLFGQSALASLLITPFRIVLNDNERTATVTIINNGTETNSYRIEAIDKYQTPDGKYHAVENAQQSQAQNFMKDWVYVRPRQVTLAPGQKQQVRLSIRRPIGIANGEYRTHLSFSELPKGKRFDPNPQGAKFQLFMLTTFTIPVQYRQGFVAPQVSISTPIVTQKEGQDVLALRLQTDGKFAAFGSLKIYSNDGDVIKELSNVAVYPENKIRDILMPIELEKFRNKPLLLQYQGHKLSGVRLYNEIGFSIP